MPGQVYHLSFSTFGRRPLFRDFRAASGVASGFHEGLLCAPSRMLAWVVMPDHAHCLLQLAGERSLGQVVAGVKSGTARRVNRVLARSGPVWARAYHDHALRREEDLRVVAGYIVANPVRAGLVERALDYPFWNTVWLP